MVSVLHKILGLLITSLMMLSAAGAQERTTQREGAVVVGAPLPLTGRLEEFGKMMRNSFEMARSQIDKTGGIGGRPLEVVYGDDEGDPGRAEEVIAQLVDREGAVMLIGGYQSDVTYAMAGFANQRDVPFLVSTASSVSPRIRRA